MDPQNPRLSADGLHVVSGFRTSIWLDGQDMGVQGHYPQFYEGVRVVFLDPEGFIRELLGVGSVSEPLVPVPPSVSSPPPQAPPTANTLAAGGGRWAGGSTAAGDVRVVTSDGQNILDATDPSMSDDGQLAYMLDPQFQTRRLIVDGKVIAMGPINLPRIGAQGVAFEVYGGATPGTNGILRSQFGEVVPRVDSWHVSVGWEVEPVIVDAPDGPWVISHDATRTLLHPVGSTWGYAYLGLKTPDCRWVPTLRKFRVIGDTTTDVFDVLQDPTEARIDLSRPVDVPIVVQPFTEAKWIGYFKWRAEDSVGNVAHVETVEKAVEAIGLGLHILCSAAIAIDPRVDYVKVVAIYVNNRDGFGGDMDDLEAQIALAQQTLQSSNRPDLRPIAAYWDQREFVRMPEGADWWVPQWYCGYDPPESFEDFLASIRKERDKIPGNIPILPAVQAYDRNGREKRIDLITRLQAEWPKLIAERGIGLAYFALDRAGGTKDRLREWQPWHLATANASPGRPAVVRKPRGGPPPPFTIGMTYDPAEGSAPLRVRATGVVVSGGEAVREWEWFAALLGKPFTSLGPTGGPSFAYLFADPGLYRLKVAATSVSGRAAETGAVRLVTVRRPDAEEVPMFPNDAQSVNLFLRVADFYANPAGMGRTHGVFTAPRRPDGSFEDPGSVLPTGIAEYDLDVRSMAVWYARYLRHFNDLKGNHEAAWLRTQADLRASDEYRNAHP